MILKSYRVDFDRMRIFVTTPAVKAGSTIFSWLLGQHSAFSSPIQENIELGSMLNVLDHIPGWRSKGILGVGDQRMVEHIRRFVDDVANPGRHGIYGIKFTNFYSYQWLSHVFPDDRIVVVVRNIFDWYASIKIWDNQRHWGWKPDSIDGYMVRAASSLGELPAVRIVHLEDLVSSPVATMAAVHDYLGLDVERVSTIGHEKIFEKFSSCPQTAGPVADDALMASPLSRRQVLTIDDMTRINKVRNHKDVISVLYSDQRRLFPANFAES